MRPEIKLDMEHWKLYGTSPPEGSIGWVFCIFEWWEVNS